MQQGRRTASLKASYEAVRSANLSQLGQEFPPPPSTPETPTPSTTTKSGRQKKYYYFPAQLNLGQGGYCITPDVCPPDCLSSFTFSKHISETHDGISFTLHTHIP